MISDFAGIQETVFLAGTGRSGTTWVEDIINYRDDHRVIFEPFHCRYVYAVRDWHYRQYLDPEETDPRFGAAADNIVFGRIRNDWTDDFCRPGYYQRRLIKDIRANLILKWIHTRHPQLKLVLLLRHPCAIAASKMALGWSTHLEDFLSQPQLVHDFLEDFRRELQTANDIFERHIFVWCIENYVPLRQFNSGEVHVLFYEDLCTTPQTEIPRLLDFLSTPCDASVFTKMSRPSALSRSDSAINSGKCLVDGWKEHVSDEQLKRANEILTVFGLDKVYGEHSAPLSSSERVLEMF